MDHKEKLEGGWNDYEDWLNYLSKETRSQMSAQLADIVFSSFMEDSLPLGSLRKALYEQFRMVELSRADPVEYSRRILESIENRGK